MKVRETLDLPYSREHTDRRRIDVFAPEGEPNAAAVLWIHGGGFSAGSKAQWHACCRHLAGLGYVCASAEYRLAPDWRFPAWVADCRLAMAWLRKQAAEYGFRADRIATAGSSAGGYLALMLATIPPGDDLGACDELGDADTRPAAVIAYCPATSMHEGKRWPSRSAWPKLMPAAEADDPELYRRASVEDRVTGSEPPILFLHSRPDKLIPVAESIELAEQIARAGGAAEMVVLEEGEHGFGYGVTTGPQRAAIAHVERFCGRWLLGER